MTLTALTVTDLLAAFRSSEPTPGGGSAAALTGAMGASLLAMVAGLPNPQASAAGDLHRLAGIKERCTAIAGSLADLVNQDSEAYETVMASFRLPKGTDEEKAARSARIQDATRAATETPLEVMRGCVEAIGCAADAIGLGNRNASSDAQVGLELLRAGLRGARLNVEINLGSLKDAAYVARVTDEVARLTADADRIA